jgi:hypothetical protein
MSVAALAPEVGWTVADACAAPGNKTTQAASYVGETGAVLACERDPRRFEILQVHTALSCAFASPLRAVCMSSAPTPCLMLASSAPHSGNYQQNEMRKHPGIQCRFSVA